jgi:Radical SAM superfamily/Iron-sulfur cluster-binding domain
MAADDGRRRPGLPVVTIPTLARVTHALPDYPRQVRVELANMCNSKCPFCHAHGAYLPPMQRPKRRMTRELFQMVLDDLAKWAVPLAELVPTAWGEIFLNREWVWMLDQIARRLPHTGIQIVTTGSLLTAAAVEALALVPTLSGVNFSINAFFGETWSQVHGLPTKGMEIALAAVHSLSERRPDVKINVSMVHEPRLQTEMEKDCFLEYWAQFPPITVTVSNASYANNPTCTPDPPVLMPCRSVFDGLVVLQNGAVGTGCCFWNGDSSDLNLGSFPDETLMDIWHGARLRRIAQLHNSQRRMELPLCKTCTFA